MRPSLLHHGLERAAIRFAGRPAITSETDVWTYSALHRRAVAYAGHLLASGVGPGDRVALMTSNRPEFVAALQGVSRAGAVAVLFNPAWKETEARHALELTAPVHGFADGSATGLLGRLITGGEVTDLDDPAAMDPRSVGPIQFAAGDAPADRDAIYVFSSGTTGLPKAVRHTHRSMAAAIRHWRGALGLGPDDRFQVTTPPSHILGLLNLVTAISAGSTVRLHRRFDLDEVLDRIQTERMTLEMAVAPIALAMANHPDLEKYDLSSLRYIMWGATPVTPVVAETVTRRTGVRWIPAYGASELPVIAANPVADPAAWRLDSAGLPPPGVKLRVADLDTGAQLDSGQVGEIQARSPSVMAGYLPDEATTDAFTGSWYRTGDVGWIEPDGWVHLTDRSKEMIKVNGFQVAPAELEAVLHGHPAVVDCAVFGVADERAGERPVAAVQLASGSPVTAGELMALVEQSLSSYKRLKDVVIVGVVPRLPSGKVLRRALRDEWEAQLSARPDGA